jgi:hypothetical protein
VSKESRHKAFLERAKEAEQHAAEALTPGERDVWLQLAQKYLDLAKAEES